MSDVEGMAAIIFDSFSRNHNATQAAERLSAAGYGSKAEAWDKGARTAWKESDQEWNQEFGGETDWGVRLEGYEWPSNPYGADEMEGK